MTALQKNCLDDLQGYLALNDFILEQIRYACTCTYSHKQIIVDSEDSESGSDSKQIIADPEDSESGSASSCKKLQLAEVSNYIIIIIGFYLLGPGRQGEKLLPLRIPLPPPTPNGFIYSGSSYIYISCKSCLFKFKRACTFYKS